jgi:hypothetical protein
MGFKSMTSYNEEKYGNFFRLQNDGDYADVVFLYRGTQDVMMVDAHYIKSDSYSGYVACCDGSCPACQSGIRVQPKIFVPLFVINTSDSSGIRDRIQFWDRTTRFQPQLVNDVFRGYPNPSEYIFRITRHGVARDINTTYDIRAIEANSMYSYDAICSRFGVTFPDYYNLVCKEVNQFELNNMIADSPSSHYQNGGGGYSSNYGQNSGDSYGNYGATPRGASAYTGNAGGMSTNIPGTNIPYTTDAPNLSMPSVPVNASIPEAAPDPNQLPFGNQEETIPAPAEPSSSDGAAEAPAETPVDPLETHEDIDTTNLNF